MLKPLTSLRFVFAFMVFLTHLRIFKFASNSYAGKLYNDFLFEGFIGVTFFYILSGFILAYTYKEQMIIGKISKKEFWLARFARIYPLHILAMLLAMPIFFLNFSYQPKQLAIMIGTDLTLTQTYIPDPQYYFSFNAPSWSLSDEAFFYALFPFLIKKSLSKWKLASLLTIPLLMVIIHDFKVPELYSHHDWFFNILPLTRVIDFSVGIYLYELYKKIDYITERQASKLEVSAVVFFILFYLFHNYIPLDARRSVFYWPPMAFLILTFALQRGAISRFLSKPFFILLGQISFAFYLIHMTIMKTLDYIDRNVLDLGDTLSVIVFALMSSLIVSYFLHKLIEVPLSKRIRNLGQRKSSPVMLKSNA